jgi:hypothetical protein
MPYYDDPLVFYDAPGVFYDDPGLGHGPAPTPLNTPLPGFGGSSSMEYWETTKERAQATLPVWQQHLPAYKVAGKTATDLDGLINQFEPLAQARTAAQDTFDEAIRAVRTALLKMKLLGTKVPQIIDAQLSENEAIQKDLADAFRSAPRTESGILGRLRALIPVWQRANAALAAMTPPGDPITRAVQGVPQTVAMAKALLDGYTALVKTAKDKEELLDTARGTLRAHDRAVAVLIQGWYQAVKASHDPGDPVYEALAGIPVPGDTPPPETIDIAELTQGGDDGLHVLVSYEPGGGAHATTREVQWEVEGSDAAGTFPHSAALDASGNALGPFTVGQIVRVRTRVSNSTAVRTSAVRTITLEEPL